MPSTPRMKRPNQLGRIILREFFHGAHPTVGPHRHVVFSAPKKEPADEQPVEKSTASAS